MGQFSLAPILFWSTFGALAYVYLGYPVLVWFVARLGRPPRGRANLEPNVSFVIAAYNEEKVIAAKLENTLDLDYPVDKLEIFVASDCSSDGTDAIVRGFDDRGIRLLRQDQRRGKTSAQNAAAASASGEILLFSDATTRYNKDVIRQLVRNFADPTVGCVAGRLVYVNTDQTVIGEGARGYWNYETFLKTQESLAGSLIGVSGCIYAVRKNAYIPMYPEACSDFLIATLVRKQGLRTVYEPEAVCFEETTRQVGKEMQMRVRVISQTLNDLWRNRDVLNPTRYGFFSVQLISHKLLRYCVPLFLVGLFASSLLLALSSQAYIYLVGVQAAFYGCAALAWILEKIGIRPRALALPLYFVLTAGASVIGFYKFMQGERYSVWEPFREVA